FIKVADVDITSDVEATFTSATPSVLKASSGGVLEAVGVGTASVTLSFRGKQDTKVVTVAPLPGLAPVLKHRYSFTGVSSSTTATHSVGNAHGTLVGGATLTGDGSVDLNGTDGYVDL